MTLAEQLRITGDPRGFMIQYPLREAIEEELIKMVNLRTKRALKRAKHKTPAELLEAVSKKKCRKVNKPAQKRRNIRRRLK